MYKSTVFSKAVMNFVDMLSDCVQSASLLMYSHRVSCHDQF